MIITHSYNYVFICICTLYVFKCICIHPFNMIIYCILIYIIMNIVTFKKTLFLERGGGREKDRERNTDV